MTKSQAMKWVNALRRKHISFGLLDVYQLPSEILCMLYDDFSPNEIADVIYAVYCLGVLDE